MIVALTFSDPRRGEIGLTATTSSELVAQSTDYNRDGCGGGNVCACSIYKMRLSSFPPQYRIPEEIGPASP